MTQSRHPGSVDIRSEDEQFDLQLSWRTHWLPGPQQHPSTVRGNFAGDDVVYVANGEALDIHPAAPGIGETLDTVRRENQV